MNGQSKPLDEKAYAHQLLLLKSLHFGRQVLHDGRHQFIQRLATNRSGSDVRMTVYLAGAPAGIDSSLVQIRSTKPQAVEEPQHA